ncbi:MAG: hypothetical protein ABGZ35_15460 [Planctomycetaceae bacterium]|jgi:hypothetical protein
MRFKFLALGALTAVSMGCAGLDGGGSSVLKPVDYVNPPAAMLSHPGPGVGGPGPGVLGMTAQSSPQGMAYPASLTQVKFSGQPGMIIGWKVPNGWADDQLYSGSRFDFPQHAVYQLKFSGFAAAGYEELQLYPTLEIRGTDPRTREYLEHSVVPVEVTEEDLENVLHNNMVTKVIYLPDPENQSRAIAGVETLISTKLAPGIDPVQQAERMGTIMVVLRFGNKNLEMPAASVAANGTFQQVSNTVYSGQQGQWVPPMPIAMLPAGIHGVPGAMIAAGRGMPGQPVGPVAGMGMTPPWGMPSVGTPIGLPGPPHLPLGAPAGLQSHTIRNRSQHRIPSPVNDLLIDVKQNPGFNIPEPVRHIQYEETHPMHAPGELAHPASRAGVIGY